MRALRHLFDFGSARRRFPPAVLDEIRGAIAASEHRHAGEIVFAVEGSLPLVDVLRGRDARDRAREAFAHLRVWDTERNVGVLVYVLIADRAIEIVADRGIAAKVAEAEWREVCALMRRRFAEGDYGGGALAGIEAITTILTRHFPSDGAPRADELPDRPVLL
ncbi:MAG TPA: TPM domain-containing protein [Dokdonella sp.]